MPPTRVAKEARESQRTGRIGLTEAVLGFGLRAPVGCELPRVRLSPARMSRLQRIGQDLPAVPMREALLLGKQPCQCCCFDIHRAYGI